MQCRNCGSKITKNYKICRNCGTEIYGETADAQSLNIQAAVQEPTGVFCRSCGAPIRDGVHFCIVSGAQAEGLRKTEGKRQKRLIIFLTAFLVLFLIVSAVLAYALLKEDNEEAEESEKTKMPAASERAEETAVSRATATSNETGESKKSEEKEVRKVVEKFFNDFNAGDFETMEDYFTSDNDLSGAKDVITELFVEGFEKGFTGNLEDAEAFGITDSDIEDFIAIVFASIKFELEDIEVSGDTATAEITLKIPDLDDLDMSDFDEEKFFEYLEEEGYSLEDITAMDEEEGMEILKEIIPKMIKDILSDAISSAPTTSQSGEIELEKDGNDWLISSYE